jgi:hypothetical protein
MSYHKSFAGAGWLSIVPGDTYPDPVVLAEIDGVDIDVAEETEDLEDAFGEVIDSISKSRRISGTVSLRDFTNSLLAIVTRGATVTANRPIGYTHSAAIPTTPFEITVPLTTPTRTFTGDLGVINLTTGVAMTRAATATGTGVYAVNVGTGVYTFHTDDSGDTVMIYYKATPSTADGTTATVAVATGAASKYAINLFNDTGTKKTGFLIPAAIIPGISLKMAKGAWLSSTLKFTATKDGSNNLLLAYGAE